MKLNNQGWSVLLLLILLGFSECGYSDTVNYCHDEAVNRQWENLANSHIEPEYKELYRFRLELCQQVDAGQISLDEAIDRFEAERARKVESLRKKLEPLMDGDPSIAG